METFELALLALAALGGLAAVGLGVVVLRAGGERAMNRRLAAVLFADALFQLGVVTLDLSGVPYQIDQSMVFVAMFIVSVAYLSFVAGLDTPISRWLRPRAVRGTIFAVMALVILADVAIMFAAAARGEDPEAADFGWPWLIIATTSLLALVAAIAAYRRAAPGTLLRRRAGFFALAFGARDVLFASAVLGWAWLTFVAGRQDIADAASPILICVATIIFASLLAYGILQSPLFDIDLRIKVGAIEGDAKMEAAERAMLDRLRVKLGLPEADTQALEAELGGAR